MYDPTSVGDCRYNKKHSIELTLALRKIGALIQSYLVQKNLEVKYGSKSFLLKKIKEFLNWRKACDTAQAKGKKPPPPPTQKYAALRAKMLEKVKKEEVYNRPPPHTPTPFLASDKNI